MTPRFSVVICTRNRAGSLERTLEAMCSQDLASPFEVLIVDNGSTDDTAGVVSRATSTVPYALRCELEPRPGKSVALNRGVAASAGELIAFTDDDAIPAPQWLSALDAAFVQYRADWAFGPVRPRWEGEPPAWFSHELRALFALLDLGSEVRQVRELKDSFFGVNCAVRRSSLSALGTYHEDLGPTSELGGGGEDSDMCLRALQANQIIMYVPDASVEHVIPRSRLTRAFHRKRILQTRQQNYELTAKSGSPRGRILGIPSYYYSSALEELGHFVKASLTGRRGPAFYHELRLLRFGGLFQQGIARVFRRRPPAAAAARH